MGATTRFLRAEVPMTTLVRIVAKVYLAVLYRRTGAKLSRSVAERDVPTSFYPLA